MYEDEPGLRRISRGHRGLGQAYNERKTVGCIITPGKDYGKIVEISNDHFSCPECDETIELDERGFAFCRCRVWNSGKSTKKLSYLANQITSTKKTRNTKSFARSMVRF